MRRALLVLLAAIPGSGDPPWPPPSGARVSLHAGSARLATAAGVSELAPGREPPAIDGPAHLQLDPGSEVELAWPRRATLRVSGPAALEWHADAPGTARVLHARGACAESRGAPLVLQLAGGWTVEPAGGLLHVESLPGGGWRVRHDAGRPAVLLHPAAADGSRARTRLLSGCRALLTDAGELRALVRGRHRSLSPLRAARPVPETAASAPVPRWLGPATPWIDAGTPPSLAPSRPPTVYTPQTFLDATPVRLRLTPWGVRRASELRDR